MGIDVVQLKAGLTEYRELNEDKASLHQRLDVAIKSLDEMGPEEAADLNLRKNMDAAYKARNLLRI